MNNIFSSVGPPIDIYKSSYAVAFTIGGVDVAWYAIFIMVGFIVAILLACLKMWKYYKVPVDPFYWFIFIGVPTAIIGANFWSCLIGGDAGKEWNEFFSSFGEGLAIEGGVIFTSIAAIIYFPLILKRSKYHVRDLGSGEPQVRKVSMLIYLDAVVPCILIAQFIGRWGNYFNQEVYGNIVTNEGLEQFLHDCLPWMYIEEINAYAQPLFLWEGLANLGMFFILYFVAELIPKKKAGDLALCYAIWYGTLRLCLEPLRDGKYSSSATMVTSAVFVVIGIAGIATNHLWAWKCRKYKVNTMFKETIMYKSKLLAFNYQISKNSRSQKAKIKTQNTIDQWNKKNEINKNIQEQNKAYASKSFLEKVSIFTNVIKYNYETHIYNFKIKKSNNKLDIIDKTNKKTSTAKNKLEQELGQLKKAKAKWKRTDAEMLYFFNR